MKSRKLVFIIFCTTLVLPLLLAAQRPDRRGGHLRYRLIDFGTLGGPISYGSVNGNGAQLLNNQGELVSYADTADPDPNAPDLCFDADCLLAHAFRWHDGVLTDLGALPGVNSSAAGSINDRGWSTGFSQTGQIDLSLPFPVAHAVLWKHHEIVDLGILDGGEVSLGIVINDRGEVIGFGDNATPDPFTLFPTGRQTRTFIWRGGDLQDIGTLGGPDTVPGAGCNNGFEGLIVGQSYTNSTPNDTTGIPTLDPFLWKHGRMIDLGSLGGTIGFGLCANNRGKIIGNSNLSGDVLAHGFVWDNGVMTDLGTLGGDQSEATWINDAGEIAGSADLPGSALHDAVVWKHGVIHDLGTVDGDPCSRGRAINSRGQVVGGSSDCANFLHAFVWEEGGPMLDLNDLIAPGSGLVLTNAININDRGEILAKSDPVGVTPIDDADLGHLVLLVPCRRADEKGCEQNDQKDEDAAGVNPARAASIANVVRPRLTTAKENATAWRERLARQYHFRGLGPNK